MGRDEYPANTTELLLWWITSSSKRWQDTWIGQVCAEGTRMDWSLPRRRRSRGNMGESKVYRCSLEQRNHCQRWHGAPIDAANIGRLSPTVFISWGAIPACSLTDCPDITYKQLSEVLINLWEIQDQEEKERRARLIQLVWDRDKQASCLVQEDHSKDTFALRPAPPMTRWQIWLSSLESTSWTSS